MAAATSSRDSTQGEDIILENAPLPDRHDGMEGADRKQGGEDWKTAGPDTKLRFVKEKNKWISVSTSGNIPEARYYHASTVIGRRMVVVGGESAYGMLNDVQQLHLGKLCWSGLGVQSSDNADFTKLSITQQLPACRRHHLIDWGKRLLLVTGETDPPMETVSVWSFDMEKENWSLIEARGEIPVARSGHTINRAGSVLILFGGENKKGKKLNDLYMFDLKSSMWLPLHAMGQAPSPRSKHVAAIYDERLLLVFGGASKSKFLNDLYALDFETMEWSRLKTRGTSPSARADGASALFGDRWYIAGGENNDTRCLDTIMLDVARMTWSVVAYSKLGSTSASQGFSLVIAQRQEKAFLVTYGGRSSGAANKVEVLHIAAERHSRSPTQKRAYQLKLMVPESNHDLMVNRSITALQPMVYGSSDEQKHDKLHFVDDLCSNQECSDGRRDEELPVSEDTSTKQKIDADHDSYDLQKLPQEENEDSWDGDVQLTSPDRKCSAVTDPKIDFERQLAAALRKNVVLEGQLSIVSSTKDEMEKNLASAIKSRQKAQRKLAASLEENEILKEKLKETESAQEESINLANIVHAENLRLDHDLTFLKSVLEDTRRELQTTREVLSEERTRSFQLQVELFELKQIVRNYENGGES